VLDKMAWEF